MKLKIWLLLVIILCVGLIMPKSASATVMVGSVVRSSTYGININYFSNHGYIEQYKPLWYAHTAEGLAAARARLVKSGKLQNIPILISIPSSVFPIYPEQTEISLESNCKISYGETGDEPQEIGKCYKVHYVGGDSYKNYLTLVASLTALTTEGQKVTDISIEQFQNDFSVEINGLQNITRHFNPIWSPNSKYVVYTVWQDGNIIYTIKNVITNKQTEVKLTEGNPLSSPLWSSDSRYMAVASLKSITIFDTKLESSINVDLPVDEKAINMETLFSFDMTRNRLLIARDKNLLSNYELLAYNLETRETSQLATDLTRPEWGELFREETYLRKNRATSPNGAWEALIKKENNISQITIEKIVSMPVDQLEKQVDQIQYDNTNSNTNNRNTILALVTTSAILLLLIETVILIKVKTKKNQSNKETSKEETQHLNT